MTTLETGASTLEDLARSSGQALLDYAFLVCRDRDQAQDLVQEVFAKLSRRNFAQIQQPVAYARRAITNEYIDRQRRSQLFVRAMPRIWSPGTIPDPAEGFVERGRLSHVFLELTPRQRAALVLRYYDDYDDAQIAYVLGCSSATVRSLISRALRELRTQMQAIEGEVQ